MPPKRSLSARDSSESSSKRPSRSSKASSLKKSKQEPSSTVKNKKSEPKPAIYGLPTAKWTPLAPPSVHLFGTVPNSITAKTTTSLQDQFSALRETVPHLSDKDWRAISYFQESAHVVLNRAYTDLYEKHQPQSTQARTTASPAHKGPTVVAAPEQSGHAHVLPETAQISISPDIPLTPSLSNLNRAQPRNLARPWDHPQPWGLARLLNHPLPWQHAQTLNHHQPMSHAQPLSLAQPTPVRPTAVAHHVSPNRPASIPKRKGCLACVSTNTCICVQNPYGEELGAILRARELRQMLGAMTTDDLIRVAAKKRYAVVPINALSSQRQFPAAMGGSAIGSRSTRPTGWQLNSAQRREVIGSESTESLIGGESEASSAPPQWTTASEAESEAEEQQQPNGGGFVRRMSEWMGHLFGRGKILKRKQDAVREFEDTTEPQEGPEGYGREKRVRRD